MIELAGKYLSKNELLRFSNPRYIRENIRYVLEVAKLVDNYPDKIKTRLHDIKRLQRPNLKISIKLVNYIVIELYAYYRNIQLLFSNTKYKNVLKYPLYFNDGTLKNLRASFAHAELNYAINKKRIDNFEAKYRISQLIKEFLEFDKIFQQLIIDYNSKIIASRLNAEEKNEIFQKYPNSKIAYLIRKTI
ncbi:hypothetical protein GOV04_04480 [Candidatus Woesearchaeota archaeon]|nr:hypothetical protein [Candidatus Woesearchaeota archaeon]